MPIILSKLLPDYPSISEIEFGFTLDEFTRPMVIYRHFQEAEIKFQSLGGWRNLRKLLVLYYRTSGKSHTEQLETNITGKIFFYKDKRVIQLTDNNVRVLIYPKTITQLAEIAYDYINDDVVKIFQNQEYANSLMTNLINIFQFRNLNSGIIEFEKPSNASDCYIYQSLLEKAELVYEIAKNNKEDFEKCLKKCTKDLFA